MSSYRHEPELSAGEEAARWLCKLQDDDKQQQAEFLLWLRQSPRHVEEFLFATAVWQKLNRFGEQQPDKITQLLASATTQTNVVSLPGDSLHPSATRLTSAIAKRPWAGRLAAAIAALSIGLGALLWITRDPTFSTTIGEQRVIRLEDGSAMHLNTHSRVQIRFTESARDVRLLAGEALFTVQHDKTRPFRVTSGSSVIQALGTQFNVYRRERDTRVSVVEGSVRVSLDLPNGLIPITHKTTIEKEPGKILRGGEQADIGSNGVIVAAAKPDIGKAVAWSERRLVFRDDRLADVANEVNRYNPRHIRIDSEAARELRLTAIFDAGDPDALLRFLGKFDGLSIDTRDAEIVVSGRPHVAPAADRRDEISN